MRVRSLLVVAIIAGTLVASAETQALATDNVPGQKWFNLPVTYKMNSALPADWRDAIQNGAAKAWNEKTSFKLTKLANTTSTDPTPRADHLIWRGDIPAAWQLGCPKTNTAACTRVITSSQNSYSIIDADTVLSQTASMGASTANCALLGPVTVDVQSIMLHELGHWGFLDHTGPTEPGDTMAPAYHGCNRTPTQHAISSMNFLYYAGSY